ncbi:hypothetical protein [Alkalimarinus alittae]|uniref:Thioredoxin domain-containing protein n=1 Tax=Alkalimarinus alittae TaxID=2961619 RepID=A0ABY6N203_9ALTE|nr:hypothetical protein [Alkalimarinus alittae]UZE96108.1 hypothetical protein NKI27_19000 [Alkalimarinus alittae]
MTVETNLTRKTIRINRLKLLGLFSIVFVPMAAATSMYFAGWGVPSGSTNNGELIWPPIHIAELQAIDSQGAPLEQHFSLDEPGARPLKWDLLSADADKDATESKWVLLVTGNQDCSEACQKALYTVRQVNIALGKESERVTRVLASSDDINSLSKVIAPQYPMLALASVNTETLQRFSAGRVANANTDKMNGETIDNWSIWVVDPLGNVILRYEADRHGKEILKDMKRLLKLSNIG